MSGIGQPGEESPHNPAAIRGPNGIWHEELLPVTDWEVPERRVVIPDDLQMVIGLPVPVLRVSRNIHEKQMTKHVDSRAYYERLSDILVGWSCWRQKVDQRGVPLDEWEIVQFIREGSEEWPLLTALGLDTSGSWNLITNHRKNDRFQRKLRDGGTDFLMRVK